MKKISLIFILLFMIIFIISENRRGYYDVNTGQVYCYDKWECLHESLHEYDWEIENGKMRDVRISATNEYHQVIAEYYKKVGEIKEENRTYMESFIYTFPGVLYPLTDEGWGGLHELYAEIFRHTEEYGSDIPNEFIQFYDKEAIYKLWKQYPNF